MAGYRSLLVVLALMTRYAALPLMAAGLFAILFLNQERNKYVHAVIFVLAPALILFFLYKYRCLADTHYQKQIVFHPIGFSYLSETASVFCSYFLVSGIFSLVKVLLLMAGVVGFSIWAFNLLRHDKTRERNYHETIFVKFTLLGMAFICLYLACLVFTALTHDPNMLKEWQRYFIPAHIIGIILFCGFMKGFFFSKESRPWKANLGRIIFIYLFLFYGIYSMHYLERQYVWGGYENYPLKFSYIIRKTKQMPLDTIIYSNDKRKIFYYCDRDAFPLPFFSQWFPSKQRYEYLEQFLHKDLWNQRKKIILVLFYQDMPSDFMKSMGVLKRKMPLHLMAQDSYGEIFDL